MNIRLLHYSAPPVVGGVENVIAHHARLLSGDDHSVGVIAGRGSQVAPHSSFDLLSEADSMHPMVLALKTSLDVGVVPPEFESLTEQLVSALARLLENVDVLIAHNVASLNKNLPLTAALYHLYRRSGFPRLVLWHHDLAWGTPRYLPELHDGYPWDLLRRPWPGATQVVVSAARQTELSSLFGIPIEQIRVIPNGIDPVSFLRLEPQTQAILSKINLSHSGPLLLLPVRITPRKNIELALRTLSALRRRFPSAQLVVTGPLGPHNPANLRYHQELTDLRSRLGLDSAAFFLAEWVEGYLPDPVIADFYRLADLLFFPSYEEGFGIPLLEAGLSALPIFCADIPPLRALGGDLVNYFSPDADPLALAGSITSWLEASPTFAMRSRVRTGFTWDQIYRHYLSPLLAQEVQV